AMEWEGQRLGFPRVSASCDYLRPVRFEDVLAVAVTVEKVGRTSVTYAFEFSKDGAAVARGRLTAVCCRLPAGAGIEALPAPDASRARLEGACRAARAPALAQGAGPRILRAARSASWPLASSAQRRESAWSSARRNVTAGLGLVQPRGAAAGAAATNAG